MTKIIEEINKRPVLKTFFLNIFGGIKKLFMFSCNKILGINNNKIVFISFNGHSYSDNPRAISEKCHELYPGFEIIWFFNNPQEKRKIVPDYVKCVKSNSFSSLKELATAKVWVDNFCKPLYIYKDKRQFYVQTWHGDRGFKKVLYNSPFNMRRYIESKICNLAIAGSEYGDKLYRTAFNYSGKILKAGSPRCDKLIQYDFNELIKIKKSLNLSIKDKILLYAPTYRRNNTRFSKYQDIDYINLPSIIKCLEKKTNERWVCLVRAHAASAGFKYIDNNKNKIIDVTLFEDMVDLLLITDFLLTDYSSSVGDFVLLKRPYIMYQPDYEKYLKEDREFMFDFKESPYYIAYSHDDLIKKVMDLDQETAQKNAENLLRFYITIETGKASEKVSEYIINQIKS